MCSPGFQCPFLSTDRILDFLFQGEWNLSSDSEFQVFPTPSGCGRGGSDGVRLLHDYQKQSAEGSGDRSSVGDRRVKRVK